MTEQKKLKLMLNALEESIESWYYKLLLAMSGQLTLADLGPDQCRCCVVAEWPSCYNCILVKSGGSLSGCHMTPYRDVVRSLRHSDDGQQFPRDLIVRFVKDEIKFLESVYQGERNDAMGISQVRN